MVCPRCQNDVFHTVETKPNYNDNTKRRKRICQQCNQVFYTSELIISVAYYDSKTMKSIKLEPKKFEEQYELFKGN